MDRWIQRIMLLGAVAVIFAAIVVTPARAQVNMAEGKWEVTSEVTMEGMPFQIPPTKTTQCITKENAVPTGEKDRNCKVLSQSMKGNTVTWKVRCEEKEGTTEGEGEITYSGASYKGTMQARMTEKGGKTQTVKMKLSGKRIGDCTEADRKEKDNFKAQAAQAESARKDWDDKLKRARELGKLTVPEDGPNSCSLSNDPACGQRFGKLNLLDGQWEIVEESASASRDLSPSKSAPVRGKPGSQDSQENFAPAMEQKSVQCMAEGDALSYNQEASCTKEKKRSGNRVTWTTKCSYGGTTTEERGGINYNGDTYEGVRVKKTTTPGNEATIYSKLSGHRVGDGDCLARRDFSARRDYSPKKGKPAEPESAVDKALNPVKSLKKIFGF
jgi:hypothetical protein